MVKKSLLLNMNSFTVLFCSGRTKGSDATEMPQLYHNTRNRKMLTKETNQTKILKHVCRVGVKRDLEFVGRS